MPFVADQSPAPWRAPVEPLAVVRAYREVAPFSRGGHRGIDLRASPGQRVGAPCAGRVSFRGSVAGGPLTITIDCGTLRATVQRVAPSVAVGRRVARGAPIGTATYFAIDLSARREDGTYLNPAGLLAASRSLQPPGLLARWGKPDTARPRLTRASAQRPAVVADRALVTPHGDRGGMFAASRSRHRVDLPLGLTAAALMVLVAGIWAAEGARRRRASPKVASGASLARVQR